MKMNHFLFVFFLVFSGKHGVKYRQNQNKCCQGAETIIFSILIITLTVRRIPIIHIGSMNFIFYLEINLSKQALESNFVLNVI